jgi:tripartite-type tricarboxylate transporter receptor subunit TctC
VRRLNQEIVQAVTRADIKDALLKAGLEPSATTAEQFAAYIKSEVSNLDKLALNGGRDK